MRAQSSGLLEFKNYNTTNILPQFSQRMSFSPLATFTATLEENSSAKAFVEFLAQGDLTLDMHDYGSFEKVADLPRSFPRNDKQIDTDAGDIILYQGNSITIYYDKNSWNFTRLARIDNVNKKRLQQILGKGNVKATFSVE